MKVKQLTVTAVIPTAQYANLQPSITVDVDGDYDQARAEAMKHIASFSSKYAEDGKALPSSGSAVKMQKKTPFIGQQDIFYDPQAHAYADEEENVYESGSVFAKKFDHEFNTDVIVPRYAAKFGVKEQDVKDFWKAKGESSTTFGTALHQALETYGRFVGLVNILDTPDKPVSLGIHPTLLPLVEAFYKDRKDEIAVYEPFVTDMNQRRAGQIDRLLIVDAEKKIVDIEDYKTNADLFKQNGSGKTKVLKEPFQELPNQPISLYTLQLNFYRSILEGNGWTVRNLTIHHLDPEQKWVKHDVQKIDV